MARKEALSMARQGDGMIKATVTLALAGVAGMSVSGQSPREWRDYAGGPDSSRFVAAIEINKKNVHQLQVAWTYPSGQSDFNPLVVRGVVYALGANRSFVALDAATGKEIWIHKGVQGFNGRGVNYWESKDGAGPPPDLQLEQHPPGDRRANRSDHYVVRREWPGRPASGSGPGSRDGQPAEPHTGSGFREPHHPWLAYERGVRSAPGDIRHAFDVVREPTSGRSRARPGEFGYETWPADAWKTVGGANNWAEQSIDEKRAIVYVPTGSPVQLLRRE